MLARLLNKAIGRTLVAVLLLSAGALHAETLTADQYLAMRKILDASSQPLLVLKNDSGRFIGKAVELRGTVNGMVKCGEATSFILECSGQSIVVKGSNPPSCIYNGNTVRCLVKVGPGSVAGLTDLRLEGAAYNYDVTQREAKLASKSANEETDSVLVNRDSSPRAFPSSKQARGFNLSSRARAIFEPYKKAIARFNPRLSAEEVEAITKSILAFSEHYQVDPRLVVALIIVESGFKPEATSRCGAMGLGQLMPGTAAGLGVSNAYDPVQNIEGSVRLIRGHLNKYGNLALALSAYNAGPGAVRKYNGVPPYRETQSYIKKVSAIYGVLCGG